MGWEGGSRTRGHGYTYGSFTLSYSRNQYNIVKQLSSIFKKRKKTTAATYLEYDHLSSPISLQFQPESQKGPEDKITIYKYTRTVTCKMENFAPM